MPDLFNANQPAGDADSQRAVAVSLSHGIRSIRHIERFVGVSAVVSPGAARKSAAPVQCVVTWGRKKNALRAEKFAKANRLPLWYLEDGWIRSCEKAAHSRKTYSLLVDKQGVYYDPDTTCDLETLLNLPDEAFTKICSSTDLQAAAVSRRLLIEHEITKYNYCKRADDRALMAADSRPLVLVVDQTLNDASVRLGGMSAERFEQMLDAAIAENPGARVVVRVHPDVVTGGRQGYLLAAARMRHQQVSACGDNPVGWLKRAAKVYVGTSQLGYEALLCGCQVIVFGKPFYAGWGLTDDRAALVQRSARRSIDQLFHTVHAHYARYINPMTGDQWTLSDCINHVVEQKKNFSRNAQAFVCVGITSWKKRYLERYLRSPEGSVRFSQTIQPAPHEQLLTWSFRDRLFQDPQSEKRLDSGTSHSWFRVEDGFLRSSGLGSDYVAPQSLVVDNAGLYFDRHQPSELEMLLNRCTVSIAQQERARLLRKAIVRVNISKYSVSYGGCNGTVPAALSKNPNASLSCDEIAPLRVLVIGQVEDDESIRRGCDDINTNTRLCQQVRKAHPDAWIVYRPHPDVVSGNRKGAIVHDVAKHCVDEMSLHQTIIEEIERCDELHTMTSLSGFEALIRGKPVHTYGMPFYAGWGLTHDRLCCDRRNRHRSLDELVYLSLIAYPRYLHIDSGEFITPEQLIDINSRLLGGETHARSWRWLRKLRNVNAAMRYAA